MSLDKEELKKIVLLQVKRLRQRLKEKRLSLEIDDDVISWITEKGYDPRYGARPLKRTIQRELETPIAKAILNGNYINNLTIRLDISENRIKLN